jgi:hypothetical protein
MFCPKCGIENLEDNKFCKECGAPLMNLSSPVSPASNDSPISFLMGFGFGVIILVAIYYMPIVPMSAHSTVTLAQSASVCGAPFNTSCPNSLWSWIFYGGWILAIGSILAGVLDQFKE